MTATAQQMRILLQQGIKQPNLQQQFLMDLIQQIWQWQTQYKEVLIGMDANENVDDPNSKIAQIFDKTDLIDVHHHQYLMQTKPATYQCGSTPIDLMLGSPLLASMLTHAWILPFGNTPMIKGDHHLLGLDFSPMILFGTTTTQLSLGIIDGVNNQLQCKTTGWTFNGFGYQKLPIAAWHWQLELIDCQLMKILLQADNQCHPLSMAPCLPEVQTTLLIGTGHFSLQPNAQNETSQWH